MFFGHFALAMAAPKADPKVSLLVWVYLANLLGPPLPRVSAIGIAGLLGAHLVMAWAAWVEA